MTASDAALELGRRLLAEAREELTRADSKAALLLASVGVVVGALLAALLAQSWSPFDLPGSVSWLWWIGAASVAVAVVALARAVYPSTSYRSSRPGFIGFFGDVVATPDADVESTLEATAQNPRDVVVDQLTAISAIVDRKYRAIQIALWALAAGAVLCLLAVLINQAL